MTPTQFQQSPHREKVEAFFKSVDGQQLFNALTAFQPAFSKSSDVHLFANENGKREGFEICMRGIIMLSTQVKPQTEITPTYGVADTK